MTTELKSKVMEELHGMGIKAEPHIATKNNLLKEGLKIYPEGSDTGFVFYDDFFEGNSMAPVKEIAMRLLAKIEEEKEATSKLLTNFAPDKEYILNHVTMQVCNRDWNPVLEEQNVSFPIYGTDLLMFPRVIMDHEEPGDFLSFLLTSGMLESLGISSEEVKEAAIAHTKDSAVVNELYSFMTQTNGFGNCEVPASPDSDDAQIVILTNTDQRLGAGVIVSNEVLDRARKLLRADEIFILPSSIHECLAVPVDVAHGADLKAMVQDINTSMVTMEERLSNHLYLYDGTCLVNA